MKNCLVLLTKVFPFDKGEEFIEDEIPMLSKAFDKIILIATSTADDAIQTREVPENFEVHRIKASGIKCKLPMNAMKFFPFSKYKGYVLKEESNEVKGSLKRRGYLTYFLAKAESVYKECENILMSSDIKSYDKKTFYSYWLYDIAYAVIKLKEKFGDKTSKAVSRTHRYDLYADKNSLNYLPLRYYLLENLDNVYPCSDDGSNYLKGLYPYYKEKIKTAYLGTRNYGISNSSNDGVYRIVSCCHVSPVKRIDLLAKSLATLKDSGLKLKWIHFGAGDGLEEVKEYSKENLSFMDVEFKGSVKNEELMNYYSNNPVDLFVNTSSSEGLPVSIMEACSFGIPTIATDVGGTSEIVNNKTGILIECDFNINDLGEKIRYMATLSEDDKQKFRDNCREIWLENFCGENNFQGFSREIQPY
ncbi:glycosyltransferase [Clostridium botulinum]|uniref:glycosyltransferase n=1 Tax=unclassified Clostridium TaxID=2614128 RepID=UPI0005061AC1|nr:MULTISPECIES: glycosyltransferase [unclassified Clostridium]AIY82178.1 glycosyl transferases group 1 family protein [Clostridium botulinum 202F]KAI3347570.1 glycosyltransferase [Clostridium botulinum]KFX56790.1 glycosyl transferase family 1 [Clostridium botulinum]KFX59632.1 glycosyl transferase family 1 [Clostridium botulinum]KON14329.1 glycosyl transferase family 1 [Clostridium botulinum]